MNKTPFGKKPLAYIGRIVNGREKNFTGFRECFAMMK